MKKGLMWIARCLGLVAVIISLCVLYGFFVEPKMLVLRKVEISAERWDGPPVRIALVSDFHIGGMHVNAKRVAKVVRKVNEQAPDIIVITGDFVNGHHAYVEWEISDRERLEQGLMALGKLSAPLGVYAALGNHDGYYGPRHVDEVLTKAGLTVLENEYQILQPNGTNFCLVGLADYLTGKEDRHVSDGCAREDNVIAIMHSPDSFQFLPSSTALALAGHTHGGQINLPFKEKDARLKKIGNQYAYGSIKFGDIPTYITAGIGTSILPARFRAPPEIVMITLRSSEQPEQSVPPK